MGKNLKGKELGVGISQRKDGTYTARFTDRNGKRVQKYFKKLQECRNWLADAQFADEHGGIYAFQDMILNAWFEHWITVKEKTVRWTTLDSYRCRYEKDIKGVIGNMLVKDIRPMHCQYILNLMDEKGYAGESMKRTRSTMSAIFSDACENGIIPASPITRSVKCPKTEKRDITAMTLDEQKKFLSAAEQSINYDHFLFILQTGVRSSELRGLQWDDVDFNERVIRIRRNVTYNPRSNRFIIGELKTTSGKRDIPMTETVYRSLIDIKKDRAKKRTNVLPFEFADHVFLNSNNRLITNSNYNECIKSICSRAGIRKISMHVLRHTFATRCIEAGMRPKTLQKILGHATLAMTMDKYVCVLDSEKAKEMKKFEELFNVV